MFLFLSITLHSSPSNVSICTDGGRMPESWVCCNDHLPACAIFMHEAGKPWLSSWASSKSCCRRESNRYTLGHPQASLARAYRLFCWRHLLIWQQTRSGKNNALVSQEKAPEKISTSKQGDLSVKADENMACILDNKLYLCWAPSR